MAENQEQEHQTADDLLTADRGVAIVWPPTNRGWIMAVRQLVLGVALGAPLLVGLWATPLAAPSATAGILEPVGPTFTCAKAFPPGGPVLVTGFDLPAAQVDARVADGFTCIPTATDEASPRFDCRFRGDTFRDRLLSQSTAMANAGGQCTLAGLPLPPAA
jgi:hypothetical protein